MCTERIEDDDGTEEIPEVDWDKVPDAEQMEWMLRENRLMSKAEWELLKALGHL